MRILIISPFYSKEKTSAFTFVHARAKIYRKFGHKVKVFVPSRKTFQYEFEGINVCRGPQEVHRALLREFDPDIVAVHSPRYTMGKNPLKMWDETRAHAPIVMWIHGNEALINAFHHYFAPWEIKGKTRNILGGTLKIAILRFLILKSNAVIYVSEWMKKMAEYYLLFRHPFSFVIPNPVDTNLFNCVKRETKVRHKGLSVREFGWKYGLDIAIRAYSRLRETSLTILGRGLLETYMRNLAKKCESNVSFLNKHIDHNEMPELYAKFGYFVASSRTEAQGVAMCEAMACGLPVIATNVGGIPEFVKNGENGLLVPRENPYSLRQAIKHLLSDEHLYDKLSESSARFVKDYLSHEIIYKKEYRVLKICREYFNKK